MDWPSLAYVAMLDVDDGRHAYAGTRAVEAPAAADTAPTEIEAIATPSERTNERPSVEQPTTRLIDDADRWRFAFTFHTLGFVAIGDAFDLVGAGVGGYFGVGVPRRTRARYSRPGFGVASEVTLNIAGDFTHRHRIATSGIVGHDTSLTRRYLSLYYFAGVGAAVYHRSAGGSVGGRVGLASTNVLHYIIALGIDLDVVRATEREDASHFALLFSLSLLTFGML